jgi:hypothetical protein
VDLNHGPLPYQFILAAGSDARSQVLMTVDGWLGEGAYGSAVVSWCCRPLRPEANAQRDVPPGLKRMQYRPSLRDGFLAKTGLDLTPFVTLPLMIFSAEHWICRAAGSVYGMCAVAIFATATERTSIRSPWLLHLLSTHRYWTISGLDPPAGGPATPRIWWPAVC